MVRGVEKLVRGVQKVDYGDENSPISLPRPPPPQAKDLGLTAADFLALADFHPRFRTGCCAASATSCAVGRCLRMRVRWPCSVMPMALRSSLLSEARLA